MNIRSLKYYHFSDRFMKRSKDYALPIAILLGIVFYRFLSLLSVVVPFMIILMLFFTFLKLSPREIRIRRVHWLLLLLQLFLGLSTYFIVLNLPITHAHVLAQGGLMCFLCPVASASPVVVALLGGNLGVATSYVLLGSLSISVIAPSVLGWVGNTDESFWFSFYKILVGITPLVVAPLLLAWGSRRYFPFIQKGLSKIPSASFWIWVLALAIIIANTVRYMVQEPREMIPTMFLLGVLGLFACIVQFAVGKWLSKKYLGESVTLGQSLAQKNSTVGIWLIHTYLNPLASVAMATYSIWQNLFNTIQLLYHHRRERKSSCSIPS